MKQTVRLVLVAVMATAMVAFAGCGKEEESAVVNNGGNNGGGTVSVEWVDLGLPSGLLWASCNVGASAPEQYGEYYAWGETSPKSVYNWSTYAHGNSDNQLTKYCNKSEYGLNGFTDNLTTLQPGDDAAAVHLGNGARTPTQEEWRELITNTTTEWTTVNNVNGRKYTAANGKSVFLPATGYRYGSELNYAGSYGSYWSASLYTVDPSGAWDFYFYSVTQELHYGGGYRDRGFSVRAVCAPQK